MSLLIKSGIIVTATDTYSADILIENEKISQIGIDLNDITAEIVDASGKLVLPGGVDPHTHFDLEMAGTVSADDHYSGHKAAAFGGTTTVIDFVPQNNRHLEANVEAWHKKADPKAAIDYGFHMNLTYLDDQVADEIPGLINLGITTLKVFTAYNQRLRLQDGDIFRVMRIAKSSGMLTMIHAENGDVIEILVREALASGKTSPDWHAKTRPAWGAIEASFRAAALSAQAAAPVYIVHMNVAGELDQLRYAREKGLSVMGETCPQYLFFTDTHLLRPDGAKWVCSPPVRSDADNRKLWEGLADNSIQVLSTDHCSFFFDGTKPIIYEGNEIKIPGKELGRNDFTKIPNGLPGVGDRLPVLWSYGVRQGRITPNQFVALCCTNPAKIFGLYPRKGTLCPGSDADIVIWDPDYSLTYGLAFANHRVDYNLYEGWEMVGYPQKVFLRGRLIVDQGKWLGQPGYGKYLYRSPDAFVI